MVVAFVGGPTVIICTSIVVVLNIDCPLKSKLAGCTRLYVAIMYLLCIIYNVLANHRYDLCFAYMFFLLILF